MSVMILSCILVVAGARDSAINWESRNCCCDKSNLFRTGKLLNGPRLLMNAGIADPTEKNTIIVLTNSISI